MSDSFKRSEFRKGELTRRMAEDYARLPQLEKERPLNESNAAELARRIDAGLFTTARIVYAVMDGKRWKVNGQHQCRALLMSKKDSLPAIFEVYQCENDIAYATLYMQFDDPMSARKFNHCLSVYADATGMFADWPPRILALCTCALGFHVAGPRNRYKLNRQERISLIRDHPDICKELYATVERTSDSKHLLREPCFAAMGETFFKNTKLAREFWSQVRDGENLTKTAPQHKLRTYLLSINIRGNAMPKARLASWGEVYAKCIHAWNAWRAGEATNLNYYPSAPLPCAK